MKKLFIILLLISVIIIAGCGEKPECTVDSDCHAGKCATASCVAGHCDITKEKNCCGNGIQEDIEDGKPGNKCTCPEDYGKCDVTTDLKEYKDLFSASCIDNECIVDTNSEKQEVASYVSEIKKANAFNIDVSVKFKNPFNVKKDLMTINLVPTYFSDNMKYFKVNSIKVAITKKNSNPDIVIEKTIDRYMWTDKDKLTFELPFSILDNNILTEYVDMAMQIRYGYKYNTNVDAGSATFNRMVTYRKPLKVVIPPSDYKECPDCDDGNDATRDYCPEGMAYCLHEPIENKCGNYICEDGENKCTCEIDCGPCTGSYSDFLDYGCVKKKCQLVMKTQKRNSLIEDGKSSGIYLGFSLDMPQPINIEKDSLEFKVKLQQFDNTIKPPIEILEVILTDNNNQKIAEESYSSGNKLMSIGSSFVKKYPLKDYYMDDREVKTKVKYQIRVRYTYLKKTNDGVEEEKRFTTFSGTFNNIVLTEPGEIS